jgi:predicted component of type VI protein secretion system
MKVRITSGPADGQTTEVDDAHVIGTEGDIVIDDAGASARHAALRPTAGGFLELEDLGSEHGTFVNGEQINGIVRLYGSEEIRVGETTLAVEADSTNETRIFMSPVASVGGAPASDSLEAPAAPATPPPAPRKAPLATRVEAAAPPRYTFAPPRIGKRGWAESRKSVPTYLMTLAIIGDAVGLTIYFATR